MNLIEEIRQEIEQLKKDVAVYDSKNKCAITLLYQGKEVFHTIRSIRKVGE